MYLRIIFASPQTVVHVINPQIAMPDVRSEQMLAAIQINRIFMTDYSKSLQEFTLIAHIYQF